MTSKRYLADRGRGCRQNGAKKPCRTRLWMTLQTGVCANVTTNGCTHKKKTVYKTVYKQVYKAVYKRFYNLVARFLCHGSRKRATHLGRRWRRRRGRGGDG